MNACYTYPNKFTAVLMFFNVYWNVPSNHDDGICILDCKKYEKKYSYSENNLFCFDNIPCANDV